MFNSSIYSIDRALTFTTTRWIILPLSRIGIGVFYNPSGLGNMAGVFAEFYLTWSFDRRSCWCLNNFGDLEVRFRRSFLLARRLAIIWSVISLGPPHMAVQKQDDQHEHTFSSYVRIRDVVLKTYLGRWTIGRSGERGSGISVLLARYDDDDLPWYHFFRDHILLKEIADLNTSDWSASYRSLDIISLETIYY